MFRQIGAPEILVLLGVVLLLFGGKKLPELARGSGRALRIFKSEVKSLQDDDDPDAEPMKSKTEALEAAEVDKKPEQG
ncbi:MAG: twin-arginine translocase TatA/TatE family subunit [Aeromicrobium sp.]|nr:twin-arginine translocase TatA/TatE family subunit [Aeromicrobium sp.]